MDSSHQEKMENQPVKEEQTMEDVEGAGISVPPDARVLFLKALLTPLSKNCPEGISSVPPPLSAREGGLTYITVNNIQNFDNTGKGRSKRPHVNVTCASSGCENMFDLTDPTGDDEKGMFFLNSSFTWECKSHRRQLPTFCTCNQTDYNNTIHCGNCNGWYHFKCVGAVDDEIPTDSEYRCPECCERPQERRSKLFFHNQEKELLYYAYQRAESYLQFLSRIFKGPLLGYMQKHLNNKFSSSPQAFHSDMKQCQKCLATYLTELDSMVESQDRSHVDNNLVVVELDAEGDEEEKKYRNAYSSIHCLLKEWKSHVDSTLEQYAHQEKVLLDSISRGISEVKKTGKEAGFLVLRTLDVMSLYHDIKTQVEQLNVMFIPQRDSNEELKSFLTAMEWIYSLYQVLEKTSHEQLPSELHKLNQCGNSFVNILRNRKHKTSSSSLSRLSINNCCAHFVQAFEVYHAEVNNICSEMRKYIEFVNSIVENECELSESSINLKDVEDALDNKIGVEDVEDAIKSARVIPFIKSMPETKKLNDQLAESMAVEKEIKELSNVSVSDLPSLKKILVKICRLPIHVTSSPKLLKITRFIEEYDKTKRVSMDNCVSLGFPLFPLLDLSPMKNVDKNQSDELFVLDKSLRDCVLEDAQRWRESNEAISVRELLNTEEAPSIDEETPERGVSLDSETFSFLKSCFDKASRLLSRLKQCTIIFPEEVALTYIVDVNTNLNPSQHDSLLRYPSMSLEAIRTKISWIESSASHLTQHISQLPHLSFLEEKIVLPILKQLQEWGELISNSWQPVGQLFNQCARGEAVVQRDESVASICSTESCSLEKLRRSILGAVGVCREKDGKLSQLEGENLAIYLSGLLSSSGGDAGLHLEHAKHYLLIEADSRRLSEEITSDCDVMDSNIKSMLKYSMRQNNSEKEEMDKVVKVLRDIITKWRNEGHYRYIPLLESQQMFLYHRDVTVQSLLELMALLPLDISDILKSIISKGQNLSEDVLKAMQTKLQVVCLFRDRMSESLQHARKEDEEHPSDSSASMLLWGWGAGVVAAMEKYLLWAERQVWCLQTRLALWSGSPLSHALELSRKYVNGKEKWQQWADDEGDQVHSLLDRSIRATQEKEKSVKKMQEQYVLNETDLNASYEDQLERVESTEEQVKMLIRHFHDLSLTLCGCETDLEVYFKKKSLGLNSTKNVEEILKNPNDYNLCHLSLRDYEIFFEQISRVCALIRSFSGFDTVMLGWGFLARSGLSAEPGGDLQTRNRIKYEDLAVMSEAWNTKDKFIESFIGQPILRDLSLKISHLYQKAEDWNTRIAELLPSLFASPTLSTRKRKKRTKQTLERECSLSDLTAVMDDPILKVVEINSFARLEELMRNVDGITLSISALFLNCEGIKSFDEGSALVSNELFTSHPRFHTLPESIEEVQGRMEDVLQDLQSLSVTFPALEALMWLKNVLRWLSSLPSQVLETYDITKEVPRKPEASQVSSGNEDKDVVDLTESDHSDSEVIKSEPVSSVDPFSAQYHESSGNRSLLSSSVTESKHQNKWLTLFGFDCQRKTLTALKNVMSSEEALDVIEDGKKLFLNCFRLPKSSNSFGLCSSYEQNSILQFLETIHIVERQEQNSGGLCFHAPWTLHHTKGLPTKAYFCNPLLVIATELFQILCEEHQRVIAFSEKAVKQSDEFNAILSRIGANKDGSILKEEIEATATGIRDQILSLQKSIRQDFMICSDKEVCVKLEGSLIKLRKTKEGTSSPRKKDRDSLVEATTRPVPHTSENKLLPEDSQMIANCSDCGVVGKYRAETSSKTGRKLYNRHKIRNAKGDGWVLCGLFNVNPRLPDADDSKHTLGKRKSRGHETAAVTAAETIICIHCSKLLTNKVMKFCCSACAVASAPELFSSLMEYRQKICANMFSSRPGVAASKEHKVGKSTSFLLADIKNFTTPWAVPDDERIVRLNSLSDQLDSDWKIKLEGSLPRASSASGILLPYVQTLPSSSTSNLSSPRSGNNNNSSISDTRNNQRRNLAEAFLHCFQRIVKSESPCAMGLSRLSCPIAAALSLATEVEKQIYESHPFDTGNSTHQKEYSKKILWYFRLFKSPGADMKMIELLEYRFTVKGLLSADKDSLIDASRKKKQAQEFSKQNLGLEERSTAVSEIFEARRRDVDLGTPSWRDGASCNVDESAGVDLDPTTATGRAEGTTNGASKPPGFLKRNSSELSSDSAASTATSMSLKKSKPINVAKNLESSSDAENLSKKRKESSGKALDITQMLHQSLQKVHRDDSSSLEKSFRSNHSQLINSEETVANWAPKKHESNPALSARHNPLSMGRVFLRRDGKEAFKFMFDTRGKYYERLCIAGIVEEYYGGEDFFLPEVPCRRLPIPEMHNTKNSHAFLRRRKKVVPVCLLFVDKREKDLKTSAYERLVDQLEDPAKERVLHFAENAGRMFEIFVYTPRQVDNWVTGLQPVKTKCFEKYSMCKWLFAEVYYLDQHNIVDKAARNCFPPFPPEKYPILTRALSLDKNGSTGQNGGSAEAFLHTVVKTENVEIKNEKDDDLDASMKRGLHETFGELAEAVDSYETFRDTINSLSTQASHMNAEMRPFLQHHYRKRGSQFELADSSHCSPQHKYFLQLLRNSIIQAAEKDEEKRRWLAMFDSDFANKLLG